MPNTYDPTKMQMMGYLNAPPDIQAGASEIFKQQQLAELLRNQAIAPIKADEYTHAGSGQWAAPPQIVPIGIGQGLAKMGTALVGGYMDKKASEDSLALANKLREAKQAHYRELFGSEAVPGQTTAPIGGQEAGALYTDDYTAVPATDQQGYKTLDTPATPGLQGKDLARALAQSWMPEFEKAGLHMMTNPPKPETNFAKVNPHDYTPDSVKAFAATGDYSALVPVRKREFVNGQAVNPYTVDEGKVIPKQANPYENLVILDSTGAIVPNQPLITAKKAIAKEGASKNVVSIAAPENEYNKDVSKKLAGDATAVVEAATAAPEVVRNARMVKDAIANGAITGTAANLRLDLRKGLETLGVIEPGAAATTQALMAGLGKITLSGVKTSGLGSGNGFTDKDREFLEGAISGSISSTPENLKRVAEMSERIATANHSKGRAILDRWKKDKALSSVAQDTNIGDLPTAITANPHAAKTDAQIKAELGL